MNPTDSAERQGRHALLSLDDVADHCQVSQRTAYRWVQRGELPAYRLGTQWRISWQDFLEFLDRRRLS